MQFILKALYFVVGILTGSIFGFAFFVQAFDPVFNWEKVKLLVAENSRKTCLDLGNSWDRCVLVQKQTLNDLKFKGDIK